MAAVHPEYVIGGCQQHLVALREDHGLEHVDDLGDVGHFQAVGVLVEDVERHGRDDGVAHRILLEEMARGGAGLHVEPGAPFVQQQVDPALGVVGVHNDFVVSQHFFDLQGLGDDVVVFSVREVRGGTFVVPVRHGVVVERDGIGPATDFFHQHLGPVVVIVGGAAGDLVEAVAVEIAAVGRIAAVLVGIELRRHFAAAAPAFIADAEELDFPGFFAPVSGAPFGLRPIFGRAGSHVAGNVWFGAQHLAEIQELVGAERIVFEGAAPVGIDHPRTAFPRPDSVLPVVFVGEAAARPAQHGDTECPECFQHIQPVSVDVRDGRSGTDPDAVVDAAPEMLGKLTVNLLGNNRPVFRLVHGNPYLSGSKSGEKKKG